MKKKRILSFLMTLTMVTGLTPQIVFAADPVTIDLSTVSEDGNGYTCVAELINSETEYVVTITEEGDYELTGTVTQTEHPTHVIVSAPTANITLDDVSITIINFSPISICADSTVNLTLADGSENTLSLGTSEIGFAGLYVPKDASVVIDGTGELTSSGGPSGAGIGGSFNSYSPGTVTAHAGNITINNGIIHAQGGNNGAGIGGGLYGSVNSVIINGGEITAETYASGNNAAGIGGGGYQNGNILITGGTVTATSNRDAVEAIGTGYGIVLASTVIITGGSVKALSPMRIYSEPKNNNDENVYLTTVTVQDNGGSTLDNTEVSCTVGETTFTAKTDSDGKLYLWLPMGDAQIYIIDNEAGYRALGTVTDDDATALIATEFNPVFSIDDTKYESWAEAAVAVQEGETITLLEDTALLASDTMPTVSCSIDGNYHNLTLNSDQSLNADITLKDLSLLSDASISFDCTDIGSIPHALTFNGTVGVDEDIYIQNGSSLIVNGTLEVNEMKGFDTMSVAADATVAAFAVRNISNLALNGTITCKYFMLEKSAGDNGILSGNGTFLFNDWGGESPNLYFSNVKIDNGAEITLDTAGYTPHNEDFLIGNKTVSGSTTAPLENIGCLVLGSGYSSFKLTGSSDSYEYLYSLSPKTPLLVPTVALAANAANGGLSYTITPGVGETGTVSGYVIQMLESSGTTEVGDEIACTGTSGNIPLSATIISGSSYCAKVKAVAGAASDYMDSGYSGASTAAVAAQAPLNTIPVRKIGVPATATASVKVKSVYTLNLENIFMDADNDAMTYTVSMNGGMAVGANANYTFTPTVKGTTTLVFAANDGIADSVETYTVTLTAKKSSSGSSSGGSSGSSSGNTGNTATTATTATTGYNATVSAMENGQEVSVTAPTLNVSKSEGKAQMNIDSKLGDIIKSGGTVEATIPSIQDVDTFVVGIPMKSLLNSGGEGSLTFNSEVGSITIPSNMLHGVAENKGTEAEITISQGDSSKFSEEVKKAIGDRPLIQLTLSIDGKQTQWNNPDAPVTVSLPYTPTKAELESPEGIIVWYIDGSGNAVCVTNGHYDRESRAVVFSTTHFSDYAIGFQNISFTDVPANAWYANAVRFMAARGIATGTGNGNFSPDGKLTRGEFIVMLMRAYGIEGEDDSTFNFSDAGNTYYTASLAAAKRLGISNGVGENKFAPQQEITRQEMFTLLYNGLNVMGLLPEGDSGRTLSDFTDSSSISSYAQEALEYFVKTGAVSGSHGQILPTETTTRGEMAQVLYSLLANNIEAK